MLRCEECGCRSDTAKGWLVFLAEDPDGEEETEVGTYCPPCAERELDARRASATTSDCSSRRAAVS